MWVWVVQPHGSAQERGKGSHLPLGCKMQGNDLRGTVANAPSNITRSFTGCLIVWHSISWYAHNGLQVWYCGHPPKMVVEEVEFLQDHPYGMLCASCLHSTSNILKYKEHLKAPVGQESKLSCLSCLYLWLPEP